MPRMDPNASQNVPNHWPLGEVREHGPWTPFHTPPPQRAPPRGTCGRRWVKVIGLDVASLETRETTQKNIFLKRLLTHVGSIEQQGYLVIGHLRGGSFNWLQPGNSSPLLEVDVEMILPCYNVIVITAFSGVGWG